MKKLFPLFVLVLLTFSLNAQNAGEFVGKWFFKEMKTNKSLKPTEKKMAEAMFKGVYIDLREGGEYVGEMMGKDQGSWSLDESGTKVELASDKGDIEYLDISADKSQLFIPLEDGKMVFERNTPKPVMPVNAPTALTTTSRDNMPAIKTIMATPDQLSKKWYFKSRTLVNPDRTPRLTPPSPDIARGSFLDFKLNGQYKGRILTVDNTGAWKLSPGGRIDLGDPADQVFWRIKSITDTELVVYKGNSEELWVFSTRL